MGITTLHFLLSRSYLVAVIETPSPHGSEMTEEHSPGPSGGFPGNPEAPTDGTLGGYLRLHHRPPAFLGSDGSPYTVSVEVERTADLRAPFSGYLVFPRWAETGVGILGHVETPFLRHGTTREQVEESLGALTLEDVNDLLEEAIRHQNRET